mmetsp:Transcript_38342/g.63668  ORF Transcript_38342/g.63668 Transcript_38342/m.63668 type:complete len:258 (-) Transcript_38342:2850-3623(-)
MLQMDVGQFALQRAVGEFKRMVKVAALDGVVDGLLHEAELCEQLGTHVATQVHGPGKYHLLHSIHAPVQLGHTDGILPIASLTVHIAGSLPFLGLGIMVLSCLQVAFPFHLSGEGLMGLLQQLLPVHVHKADHVIKLTGLLVHVDGKVRLVDFQVQPLGLFVLSRDLQLLRLIDIQCGNLLLRHIHFGHSVCRLPHIVSGVHLHCLLPQPRFDVILFCFGMLPGVFIMGGNQFVELLRDRVVGILRIYDLHRLCPLS